MKWIGIIARHSGHSFLVSTHASTHDAWNMCVHCKRTMGSFLASCSKQILQVCPPLLVTTVKRWTCPSSTTILFADVAPEQCKIKGMSSALSMAMSVGVISMLPAGTPLARISPASRMQLSLDRVRVRLMWQYILQRAKTKN